MVELEMKKNVFLNEIEEYSDGHRYQHCYERRKQQPQRRRERERSAREEISKIKKKNYLQKTNRERSERERDGEYTKKPLSLLIVFLRVFMYILLTKLYIYIFEWCLTTVKLISLNRERKILSSRRSSKFDCVKFEIIKAGVKKTTNYIFYQSNFILIYNER